MTLNIPTELFGLSNSLNFFYVFSYPLESPCFASIVSLILKSLSFICLTDVWVNLAGLRGGQGQARFPTKASWLILAGFAFKRFFASLPHLYREFRTKLCCNGQSRNSSLHIYWNSSSSCMGGSRERLTMMSCERWPWCQVRCNLGLYRGK